VQRETAALAAQLGGGVRLEITVGALPSGLQLAPCVYGAAPTSACAVSTGPTGRCWYPLR
jgi:hypothetical protein